MKLHACRKLTICILTFLFLSCPLLTISHADTATQIEQLSRELNNMSDETPNPTGRLLYLLSSGKDVPVSQETKDIIKAQFERNINRETILLAGFAGVDSLHESIARLAELPLANPKVGRFFGTNQWAANLVMAREGNEKSVDRLLSFASTQDLHTQVVFVAVDFQYVPNGRIVSYLKNILFSDERLEPTKETVPGLPVANYAAFSLARILKGFPVRDKEDFSYSEEEISACRNWMSGQSGWRFN